MTPEQRAGYEQVEHDLRMALVSLSGPYANEVAHIRKVRELMQQAHDIVEAVLLDRVTSLDRATDGTSRKTA